jgi:hypothetical protein
MRVRHLQSHLQKECLIQSGQLAALSGYRIGVDAVYWLRSMQALKDPFAEALGGVPPGIFGFVNLELDSFKRHNITPVFVFQGMAPVPQHSMFISRMDTQMDMAWTFLARGNKLEAQKCFAVSTSRINNDFVYFIFHHLRHMGYEVVQAPYFVGAQLAHFCDHNVVDLVFGPPGLMLYNIQRVVILLDFQQTSFECVDLPCVLNKWQIDRDQFVDACMLAGTEYCLTYPYLNLGNEMAPARFDFDAAVYIIKQAPLINWMATFPTQEMKNDHINGYCICKVMVQSSPVLHLVDQEIRPFNSTVPGSSATQVPTDFSSLMGDKLPNCIYYLMLQGILWHKLPQALATGTWLGKSKPMVDTKEIRDLVADLQEYRQLALGLVAAHLPPSFSKKPISCKAFWDQYPGPNGQPGGADGSRILTPKKNRKGLRWRINIENLHHEMMRQGVEKVDLKFCLQWHAYEFEREGPLYQDLQRYGDSSFSDHPQALAALVHFMLLEHLELIADDGGMTVLGNVLKDTPRHLQEPCLVALEMMKFGVLNGEPFEVPPGGDPFPAEVSYPQAPSDSRTKSVLLLSRVFSLVPMRLRNARWNADVVFDLTAFHSLVRVLKRSLRQLTEASLASVLLKDMTKARLLPLGFMCSSPDKSNDHMNTASLFPVFMLPRACMGIVSLYFLNYQGDPPCFHRDLTARFPCCAQAKNDLKDAMVFWQDLMRCVGDIAGPLGAEDLFEDMKSANVLLQQRQQYLGVYPDGSNLRGDEHRRVTTAVLGEESRPTFPGPPQHNGPPQNSGPPPRR